METIMCTLFKDVDFSTLNNALTTNLLSYYNKQLTNPQPNTQFGIANCPVSLLGILVPLMMGSSGQSLSELCQVLKITPQHIPKLYEQFALLHSQFAKKDGNSKYNGCLESTNLMLSNANIPLYQEYIKDISLFCTHSYFSDDDIPQIATTANDFVEKKTHGLIKNILNPSDIPKDGLFFVLLNTLYFKCNWEESFPVRNTKPKQFYGFSGQREEQMMHDFNESYTYTETTDCQCLLMPYQDNDFSMLVVLPKDKLARAPILDHELLRSVVKNMKDYDVNITFPKFTQEVELDLIPFFKQNGASRIFNDLEIADMTDNTDRKLISLIKQKVKIIVDENGTEAAAATTAVCILESCCMKEPAPVVDFVADHPFTYYIMYKDVVLFSGTYE